jgi:uncharacterized protein YndB with AHSA1/START domain
MRVVETFSVARPPEVVFDYVADPGTLLDWQTAHTSVEQLTEGPPALGTRVRERTKPPGGKEFEQIVEFAEFDRPRRLRVHVIEGPYPIDGAWTFEPEGDAGTRVRFTAEGQVGGTTRAFEPILKRLIARQFAGYHRNLRRNVEAVVAADE